MRILARTPEISRGRRRRFGGRRQRGYSLIFLVMIFTTMSILAAASLPAIEQVIRRNKEEELIFRGFQYAEAIRVFQRRFGRYPIRLSELVEVKPRCIRQLWKDPMTDDGKWGLISVNGATAPGRPAAAPPSGVSIRPIQQNPAPGMDESEPPAEAPGDADQQQNVPVPGENLPILGVYSRSDKTAIKTLFGKTHYKDWRFSTEVLRAPFGVGPGGSVPRVANATWIGRPFRQGVVQPGAGIGPRNGSGPGGMGVGPTGPGSVPGKPGTGVPGIGVPGTNPGAPATPPPKDPVPDEGNDG